MESPKSSVGSCPSPLSKMNNLPETNEDDAKWPDRNVSEFLRILNERMQKSATGQCTFKPADWNAIDCAMQECVGVSYGIVKLKGKYNRLKMTYNRFSELVTQTGVTYNPATNTVDACEDTWNKFFLKHPTFKAFKRNGCKHYPQMVEVFARSVATGGLANSSAQVPATSDDEHVDKEVFLHTARPSSNATDTGGTSSKGKRSLDDMMEIGGSTRKSSNKKWKDAITNVLRSVSATMTEKEQRRKARQEEASTVSTADASPYTMKACIEILKNMDGIPPAAIRAAFHHLANPDMREGFIEMPPEWQRDWVLSLQ